MIDTLVKAGMAFENETYVTAGIEAVNFIKTHLWKDGTLLRRFREGEADYEGGLDDYASLIRALITLYESGQGEGYLEWALEMTTHLECDYKADDGAFYLTGPDHSILLRRCELYDSSHQGHISYLLVADLLNPKSLLNLLIHRFCISH